MADVTKQILIQLGIEETGLKSNLKAAADEVQRLNKLYEESIDNTGKFSKESLELKNQIQAANTVLRQANKDLINFNLATVEADDSNKALRAQLSLLTKEYDSLSEQERETTARGKELYNQINNVTTSLNKSEQATQRYTRNVGNYASVQGAFNQVLREAPAFANSLQTGMMAISNNLPILADELKRAKDSGGSWMDVIKNMGAAMFGFSGIITIVTTALTFLPKLFKDSTDAQKENTKVTKQQTEEYNKLNEAVKDSVASITENKRKNAENQDEYDLLTGKITKQEAAIRKLNLARQRDTDAATLETEKKLENLQKEEDKITEKFNSNTQRTAAERKQLLDISNAKIEVVKQGKAKELQINKEYDAQIKTETLKAKLEQKGAYELLTDAIDKLEEKQRNLLASDKDLSERDQSRLRRLKQEKEDIDNLIAARETELEKIKLKKLEDKEPTIKPLRNVPNLNYFKEQQDQVKFEREIYNARLDLATTFVQGFQNVLSTDEKNRKKYGATIKALAIAEVGINLARELSNISVQASANPFNFLTFGAAGITQYSIQAVAATAKAAFQTAAILRQKFAGGGFTGNGYYKDETGHKVAGVVHDGEWVAKKSFVNANPNLFRNLDAVQKGYASGGFVTSDIERKSSNIDINTLLNSLPTPIVSVVDISAALNKRISVIDKARL